MCGRRRFQPAHHPPSLLQKRVALEIPNQFQLFKDPKETFAVSRRAKQLYLRAKQRTYCPVPFVLDLRIAHERFGSNSDPSINGHLHYPNNLDGSLNEAAAAQIKYDNTSLTIIIVPLTLSPLCLLFLVRLGVYIVNFVRLLFLQAHRETDRFFAASGFQLAQSTSGQFHYRRSSFSSQIKSKVGNILAKAAALCITLNIDGAPIASSSHTHPSHSQPSRLLTSSLSLGVPVPRATQCTTRFQETWLQIGFPCQLKLVCRQEPVPSLPRSWPKPTVPDSENFAQCAHSGKITFFF
jgi:hypothetical protein